MAKTYDELLAAAEAIRTNTLPDSNTADIVGSHLKDVINKDKETSDNLAAEIKEFQKTNNSFETIMQYDASKDLKRANNFVGVSAFGIVLYAIKDGTIEYGIYDIITFEATIIGQFNVVAGVNVFMFDSKMIVNSNSTIYIHGTTDGIFKITGSGGIGMYEVTLPEHTFYSTWELPYWLITNNSTSTIFSSLENYFLTKIHEVNTKLEQIKETVYYKTLNEISTINTYDDAADFVRANKFPACNAKGIVIYAKMADTIKFGTLNVSDYTHVEIGTFNIIPGLNYLYFENQIIVSDSQQIYIKPSITGSIKVTNTGGIGMYEANTNNLFDGWELPYWLIGEFGIDYPISFAKRWTPILESYFGDKPLAYGEIILPKDVHIAKGRECNLWWSSIANVAEGDKSIYFETICEIGRNTERGFVINEDGTTLTVGNYPLRIISRKIETREIISDVTTTVHVVSNNDANTTLTRNLLQIGDSRTWQSYGGVQNGTFVKGENKTITTETKALLDANIGAAFNLVGSFVSLADNTIRNLATSGAGYSWATSQITGAGGIVAFAQNNGLTSGGTLDYTTIMYGINDLESWGENNPGQYDISIAKIPGIILSAKTLIDTILAGYPNCKILIILECTTCANQDGFGYWANETTWRDAHEEMEKAEKLLRKKIIETFDNGIYSANVKLSTAGLWCDRIYGFPYITKQVSTRASINMKKCFIECVHPFDDGYKQISDGIFSTIKYFENN